MQSGNAQRTIFIVDDDHGLLRLIERALRRENFATATAASGREALAWLSRNHTDLLLLDLKLPDIEGKDLIHQLSLIDRNPPFIIITGEGDERVAVDMMKRGAMDYLVKDVDFLQFVPEVVKHALEQLETGRRLAAAEEQVNLIQSVVEHGFSAVLIASADLPDPRILYINPAFAQLTGHQPGKVAGQPLSTLAGLTAVQERLRQGVPQGESFLEEVSTYKDGERDRWVEWRVGPVRDKAGRVTNWLVILRDITERKRLEKEILEISDREQRRIGQDLHDGLCQQLAGIELMSQVLEQKLAVRSKSAAARVGDIAGHVREAISQTRLLARGLSPVTLESEGLMSALEELASNTQKMFSVVCRFACDPPVLVHDQSVATHLFRIAQEAVSNAIKHGKATEIDLQLTNAHGWTNLIITDQGAGFPEVIPRRGMGLRIMRSRAAMIAGTLAIDNNPAGGGRVICSVPDKSAITTDEHRHGRKKEKSH